MNMPSCKFRLYITVILDNITAELPNYFDFNDINFHESDLKPLTIQGSSNMSC